MLDYVPRIVKVIGDRAEEVDLPVKVLECLSSLDYEALEVTVCKLLSRMGYHDVGLLGRNSYYGKSTAGGADLAGKLAAGLGHDRVLVQVKQYSSEPVRTRMVDELRGACLRQGATHGVLVTTGQFVPGAHAAARRGENPKAICIDGPLLAELCIDQRLGVEERPVAALVLDASFFHAPKY